MLLLVTILLVLVAAVTLLIGIFSDNLALIFISIGASAIAAIVLAVLSQMSRRKARDTTSAAPEPLPSRQPAPSPAPAPAPSPATSDRGVAAAAATISDVGEPVTTPVSAVGVADLPIANYDTMRVNDIIPALDGLDLDELETVAQYEESNKNRTTVLNRIDDLMDELEAVEAGTQTPAPGVVAAAAETIEDIGEPVVAAAAADDGDDDGFPIPNYDALSEDEVIDLLQDLDADELETVADREEAGSNRDAVLDAIDDRLDVLEGIVPAPPVTKVAAKKTATTAKKAAVPAKKSPAKKAVAASAKKAATAAKKAAPAPAKRTAVAPAKKSAAPAKKSAAATVKKAPASTKTAKKTAAPKKAAPVKKATAAKKATKTSKR